MIVFDIFNKSWELVKTCSTRKLAEQWIAKQSSGVYTISERKAPKGCKLS